MISERISDDVPIQNENFEYGYPKSNAHKAARHQKNCDVIINVNLFPIVYRRIYCRKFLTFPNQTSRLQTQVH